MPTSTPLPVFQPPLPADALLEVTLDLSLAAVQLWRPLYDDGGALTDFALEYLNPAGQRMLRLPARPGGTLLGRFPTTTSTGVFAFYRQVFESGHASRLEMPYQADGLDDYYRVAAARCEAALVVSFTDTSDHPREAVEQALRESQARERLALADALRQRQRLLSVLEQVPALVARVEGPEHLFVLANAALHRLFPDRPLVGRPLREATPELAAAAFPQWLDEAYRTGVPRTAAAVPVQLRADEPAARYYDVVCQPSLDADGLIGGVMWFAYDVTRQVQAQQALRQLNANLETQVAQRTQAVLAAQADALAAARQQAAEREAFMRIFEQSPALLLQVRGPEHLIDYVNPAFQQVFDGQLLVGRRYADALPELVALGTLRQLDAVLAEGLPRADADLLVTGRPAQPALARYYTFAYQPYVVGEQQLGVTVLGTDVTEQVLARHRQAANQRQTAALAEELLLTNQRLLRINADLDAFRYAVSHDLNAPLTNLQGLLQVLREELPAPVQQLEAVEPVLHLMQHALNRFQRTLTDLTDVIRQENTGGQPAQTVDLTMLLADIQLDLHALLAEAQPRLELDLTGCTQVHFAPGALRSILYNLLSNSLKYRDPDRPLEVRITCATQDAAVELHVCDNGRGLTPEQQQRLFTLFQRLHPEVNGAGVGLYAVKKLVTNAGGTIAVRSQPGAGACFTVRLPQPPVTAP